MNLPDFSEFIKQLNTDEFDKQMKDSVDNLEKDNQATVASISTAMSLLLIKEYHQWLNDNL